MGMTDKERAIEVLAHALWHIDDGSIDEAVVIRALLEHAVAIAHGQWEPTEGPACDQRDCRRRVGRRRA